MYGYDLDFTLCGIISQFDATCMSLPWTICLIIWNTQKYIAQLILPFFNPLSYPTYLWAAVRSGRAPVEVVLGQKEGRIGHVQDGVVHQYNLAEVKLVGETLPFGFVQNTLVVVIPAVEERISKEG